MKTISSTMLVLLLLWLMASSISCVLEEKVIEIVVTGKTCVDFEENEDSENFTTPVELNYAAEIDSILEHNDLDRSDIESAHVVSATYTVTDFEHDHDWVISGAITVTRMDEAQGPATLIEYTSVSLEQVLEVEMPAVLEPGGVDLLNDALSDYITNPVAYPVLQFTVENGDVEPAPSLSDSLVFDWTACVTIHVVIEETYETPDVF